MADVMGLYEVYWEVPGGEVEDSFFMLKKELAWNDVANTVNEMLYRNEVILKFISNGIISNINNNERSVINNKENWLPFDISKGSGYILLLPPARYEK
ncbi:hypothetical protein [Phyllobacterium sp. SB3]|uniref:hypothetical protein n=1 Tax=Phyllobacterium sp. SB3 TaxID=3156073 RepID=UPI0032B02487